MRGCDTAIALITGLLIVAPVSAGAAEAGIRAGRVAAPAAYRSAVLTPMEGVQHVAITVNKSGTFKIDHPFNTATIGAPDIVDVMPLSDKVIYLQGKKIGTTNVSLFDQNSQLVSVIDVEVVPDIGIVRSKLRASAGLGRVRVSSAGGQIVLSGTAQDAVSADHAMDVARGIAGANVVNAMEVAPSQQVLLEVRFLEAARTEGRDVGVNIYGANSGGSLGARTGTGIVGLNGTTSNTPSGIPIFETANGLLTAGSQPFGTFIGRLLTTNNTNIDVVINALEQKGLVRRLAEPNLTALSGGKARFNAGGEFPVPVPSQSSAGVPTIAIQFKEFGVTLDFTPTVLAHGVIDMTIHPLVSELDFADAVQIQGTVVPALTKREASTQVQLRDGQSFAIAGLLQSQGRRNISQLPWVGSVPVLGSLFRSASFQNNETDLVIVVTPHLVSPAAPNEHIASPLESRLPSNDVDFFLNGQPEVKKKYREFVSSGGGLKGPYGHIIRPYGSAPVPVGPAAAGAPVDSVISAKD